MDLFSTDRRLPPLAWRMQPQTFDDFIGQSHLLGPNRPLRRLIEEDRIVSLILYGPPGSGKTALAHIIANRTQARFIAINAVTAGIKEIREAVITARSGKTILFVDEIHRFNKLQQDGLLPSVENGQVILIGASTQNPFFALVPALSSRSLIFQFQPLSREEITTVIRQAVADPRGLGNHPPQIEDDAIEFIAGSCEGDARRALNILEIAYLSLSPDTNDQGIITAEHIREAIQVKPLLYNEDEHYDTISAFIKSMRGSDPDATVYWLAKMLEAGEDPLFIARRIVICAAEDVGNADPRALTVAVSALHAFEKIGLPEGRIPLSMAALYVATAPKSNASYLAIEKASEAVRTSPVEQVPVHLRDSHYTGSARLGAGEGYRYPHDYESHYVEQEYLPSALSFYIPSGEGFEKIIQSRIKKRRRTNSG